MEVERLTATLDATGLAGFNAAMAAADKATGSVSNELKSLAAIAKIADAALSGVKISATQAAQTQGALATMQRSVSGVTATALAAADALDQVKIGQGQAATTAASSAEMVASLDAVAAAAADARRSLEGLALAGAAGGAAGGGGGLLAALGWGRGGRFMGMGGMAAFGSVLGLAGFGLEHVITSIVGVGGSMLGGLAGGGLLGLGALGTSAVGMGTDMAGIGQAAGDIKQVTTGLGNLQTAIQTYGRNSQQAAQAQAQLNTTLNSFSPVAQGAVLAASQTARGFRSMFDQVSGQAEKTGAEIINQAMHVGESFLPTVGKYAAQNMGIIQSQLQPLFGWLQNPGFSGPGMGGGLGIFTNLEQIFQRNLPAAVQAGSQAFKFFVRTVDVAAQQTGHFMATLDRFFTHMNTPAAFSSWAGEVNKLIGLFRTWMGLAGSLVGLVADIFKPAVGFGQAFAQELTNIINQVRTWLQLSSTQATMHGLFDVHLVEVIQGLGGVLRALLPAVEAATSAFMKMETVLSGIAAGALKALATLINTIMRIPFAAQIIGWAGALTLVYKANTLLFGALGRLVGFGAAQVSENDALIASYTELTAAIERLNVQLAVLMGEEERAAVTTATLGDATAATGVAAEGAFAGIAAGATAMLGPIAAAVAAVYLLDKAVKALTGIDFAKRAWGSAGWFADNTAGDRNGVGGDPFPKGSGDYYEWLAGRLGIKPGTKFHGITVQAGTNEAGQAYWGGKLAREKAAKQRQHHDHAAAAARSAYGGSSTSVHVPGVPKVQQTRYNPYGTGQYQLLPVALQSAMLQAQTRADLTGASTATGSLTPKQLAALRQVEESDRKALGWLDKQHATGQKLLELERERQQVAQQLAQTQQQIAQAIGTQGYVTAQGGFQMPLGVQLAMAKAAAQAALISGAQGLTPQQMKLALQVKAAVMRAINSHKLTMQGLIDAWNEIATINAELAQSRGMIDTYHAVSSHSITDAVKGLTQAQKIQLDERISQAEAHRGHAPNGPAVLGEPVRGHHQRRRHPLYSPGVTPGSAIAGAGGGITINGDVYVNADRKSELVRELKTARRGVRRR